MDTAVTQIFAGGGNGGIGGQVGAAAAAPVSAIGGLAQTSQHLTLLGVVAFILVVWVLIRLAGFRFGVQVATGVGR